MARYHINHDGNVLECDAKIRCPLGGDLVKDHFSSKEEAYRAYEKTQGSLFPISAVKKEQKWETVIPEKEFDSVVKTVKASEVKEGDTLKGLKEIQTVKVVKSGYKNSVLTTETINGKRKNVTFEKNAEVEVVRNEETAESKAAIADAHKELALEKYVKTATPVSAEKALDSIRSRIDKGYLSDGFQLSSFVEAEAADKVEAGFISYAQTYKEKASDENPYSTAFSSYKEKLQAEIIQDASRSSVSTSEAHNYMDRELLAAKATFISRGHRYYF